MQILKKQYLPEPLKGETHTRTEQKVEELAAQMAELSLIMKKSQDPATGTTRFRTEADEKYGCSYGNKPDNRSTDCWTKGRDAKLCRYCDRRGHSEDDFWTQQRDEPSKRLGQASKTVRPQEPNVICEPKKTTEHVDLTEKLGTVRRGRDGQLLPKQGNQRNPSEQILLPPLRVPGLYRSEVGAKKSRKTRRVGRRQTVAKELAGKVEHYDVVSGVAQANAGINIGQLLRGDVKKAAMTARKLFGRQASKKVVTAALDISEGAGSDKRLNLVDAKIYGTTIRVLLDSGVIPNVISMDLCEKLHLTPRQTGRRVTVADGKEAIVLGKLLGVPITVGDITKDLTFLLVERSPFELIVGRPSMKEMRAVLDVDHETATFRDGGKIVRLPLWSEGVQELGAVINEFTSDDEGEWEDTDDSSDGHSNSEGLVLCLKENNQDMLGYAEEEAVSHALSHLEYCEQNEMRKAWFAGGSVVAWHLDDLRPSEVPYIHSFELSHDKPICLPARRMPFKHNEVVRKEIDGMLQAHLIKPTKSPWGFPVVIVLQRMTRGSYNDAS